MPARRDIDDDREEYVRPTVRRKPRPRADRAGKDGSGRATVLAAVAGAGVLLTLAALACFVWPGWMRGSAPKDGQAADKENVGGSDRPLPQPQDAGHDAPLSLREAAALRNAKSVTVAAEDVRHLEGRAHRGWAIRAEPP